MLARNQLARWSALVVVMAVGSCSSLPARPGARERMKFYILDAASSLGFNLKTEQGKYFLRLYFPSHWLWQISVTF